MAIGWLNVLSQTIFRRWKVSKPDWGKKRTCPNCGARFYDMKRQPATCPKCSHVFEVDIPVKPKRAAAPPPPPEPVKPKPSEEEAEALEDKDAIEIVGLDDDDDKDIEPAENDDSLIEDASDLGEDDDDMSEVMEHIDEEVADNS